MDFLPFSAVQGHLLRIQVYPRDQLTTTPPDLVPSGIVSVAAVLNQQPVPSIVCSGWMDRVMKGLGFDIQTAFHRTILRYQVQPFPITIYLPDRKRTTTEDNWRGLHPSELPEHVKNYLPWFDGRRSTGLLLNCRKSWGLDQAKVRDACPIFRTERCEKN